MKNTLQLTIGLIKQKIQEILDKKSIIKQSYDDNDNLGDYTKNTEYIVLENEQENLLNDSIKENNIYIGQLNNKIKIMNS